jgi:hypothetical protein
MWYQFICNNGRIYKKTEQSPGKPGATEVVLMAFVRSPIKSEEDYAIYN